MQLSIPFRYLKKIRSRFSKTCETRLPFIVILDLMTMLKIRTIKSVSKSFCVGVGFISIFAGSAYGRISLEGSTLWDLDRRGNGSGYSILEITHENCSNNSLIYRATNGNWMIPYAQAGAIIPVSSSNIR